MYDVVVVGGGVVGCAVARLLSHHDLVVAVLEAGPDIGAGTSKANTAILHTGFDATPGSLESRLVARGYALLRDYAPSVGISVEDVGALLVAWDDEQAASLAEPRREGRGQRIRARRDRRSGRGLRQRAPSRPWRNRRDDRARRAHHRPVVDTVGVRLRGDRERCRRPRESRGCDVRGRRPTSRHLTTPRANRSARDSSSTPPDFAGDELHRSLGLDGFTIRPRRGELIVFDKLARPLLNRTVLARADRARRRECLSPRLFRQRDVRTRPPMTSTTRRRPARRAPESMVCSTRDDGSCPRCSTRR